MDFTTEPTDYDVAEFYEHFHNCLPKIVKITQGFCGGIVEDTFDRDQMMHLHAVSRQKRVVAKMIQGNHTKFISIPLNYNEKLCVVKQHGKTEKEKDMFTIIKDNTLPLTVQFPKDRFVTVGNHAISTNHIPPMELLETFDEIHLLGNFITDGVMGMAVVHVPLYLSQMRMAVATGIVGQPKAKWFSYIEELDEACGYIKEFGNPNIAEYDPSAIHSDTTYCYLEPRMYSNIVNIFRKPPTLSVDSQVNNPEHYQELQESPPGVYEEIDNTTRDRQHPVTKSKPNPSMTHPGVSKRLEPNKMSVAVLDKPSTKPAYQTCVNKKLPPLVAPKPFPAIAGGVSVLSSALPKQRSALPKQPPKQNSSAVYCNVVPRGEVNPITSKERHGQSSPAQRLNVDHEKKKLREVSFPEDVDKLTVEEVGEYMKKLNLDHFVDSFKTEMIDGSMLRELDKEVLESDFGMKKVEAMRLTKFARTGHVPL